LFAIKQQARESGLFSSSLNYYHQFSLTLLFWHHATRGVTTIIDCGDNPVGLAIFG
jgi:hypothetical protein